MQPSLHFAACRFRSGRSCFIGFLSGLLAFSPASLSAQDFVWTTLAGNAGGRGQNNGTGSEARLSSPYGGVLDPAGTLLVTESGNHTIRRISADGVTTLFAGMPGSTGTADGPVADARFNQPRGVARDREGNLFIVDAVGTTVRRLSIQGQVTTVAGTAGVTGSADGPAATATFSGLRAVAVNGDGTLFLSDSFNQTIRKISPDGMVSTWAGKAGVSGRQDGRAGEARFLSPRGICLMPDGALCVADGGNHVLRRISPDGEVTTLAGLAGTSGFADGQGTEARFYQPNGVSADAAGNLYVTDSLNAVIRKVSLSGNVTTVAGAAREFGSVDGTGAGARFAVAQGLLVRPDGNIVVMDTGNQAVRLVTPDGVVTTLAGAAAKLGSRDGTGSGAEFHSPSAIALGPDGNLAVTDEENHTIRTLTSQGTVGTLTGKPGVAGNMNGPLAEATFNKPAGLAFSPSGALLVADRGNNQVRSVSAEGIVSTRLGDIQFLYGRDRLLNLLGLAVDGNDRLYVGDGTAIRAEMGPESLAQLAGVERRHMTMPDGSDFYSWDPVQAGSLPESPDGTGVVARIGAMGGAFCDSAGTIFFADTRLSSVRECSPSGTVETLVGAISGEAGCLDGTGLSARFRNPGGIALGPDGALYVADSGNHVIRRVSRKGVVTTIGGIPGYAGIGEGDARRTQFSNPTGLAFDSTGALLVADRDNHRIVRGVQTPGPHLAVETSQVAIPANAAFDLPVMVTPGTRQKFDVVVHNTGTTPLEIFAVALETEEPEFFSLPTAPVTAVVPPDGSASFPLVFAPQKLGRFPCTLVIRSNDVSRGKYRTELTGIGNTPPVFSGFSFRADLGEITSVSVADIMKRASDFDGQPLTFTLDEQDPNASSTCVLDGDVLSFYPGWTQSYGVFYAKVTIHDPLGGTARGRITVNVAPPFPEDVPFARMEDGHFHLFFQTEYGLTYRIQRSENLVDWWEEASVDGPADGYIDWADPGLPAGRAFYRIVLPK